MNAESTGLSETGVLPVPINEFQRRSTQWTYLYAASATSPSGEIQPAFMEHCLLPQDDRPYDLSRFEVIIKDQADLQAVCNFGYSLHNNGYPPEDSLRILFGYQISVEGITPDWERDSHLYWRDKVKPGDLPTLFGFLEEFMEKNDSGSEKLTLTQSLMYDIQHLKNMKEIDKIPSFIAKVREVAAGDPMLLRYLQPYNYEDIDLTKQGLARVGTDHFNHIDALYFLGNLLHKNSGQITAIAPYLDDALQEDENGTPRPEIITDLAASHIKRLVGKLYSDHKEQIFDEEVLTSVMHQVQENLVALMPHARSVIEESFSVIRQLPPLRYAHVSQGKHPDLPDGEKSPDRVNVAVTLALRDLFTPVCTTYADTVTETSSEEIQNIARSPHILPQQAFYNSQVEKPYADINIGNLYRDLLQHVKHNARPEKLNALPHASIAGTQGFERFLWAPWKTTEMARGSHRVLRYVVVPVGEYGEQFSGRMFETLRVMLLLTEAPGVINMAADISEQHERIMQEVARGADFQSGYKTRRNKNSEAEFINYSPAIHALQEGILSLGGAISFLTAQKIPDFENPDHYLEALIAEQLPNELSLRLPMTYLMPKVISGRYFNEAVTRNAQGHPELSSALKQDLSEKRKLYREMISVKRDELGETGHGYPVGRRGPDIPQSGIETLSESFLQVYKILYG